ncbi:ABC transporter ATP-binding protein, partial [Streptomyces sp. NPDC052023]
DREPATNRNVLTDHELADNRNAVRDREPATNRNVLTDHELADNRNAVRDREPATNRAVLRDHEPADNRNALTDHETTAAGHSRTDPEPVAAGDSLTVRSPAATGDSHSAREPDADNTPLTDHQSAAGPRPLPPNTPHANPTSHPIRRGPLPSHIALADHRAPTPHKAAPHKTPPTPPHKALHPKPSDRNPLAPNPLATRKTTETPHPPPPQEALHPLPPPISVRPAPTPLRPLRYELRRATGISTGFVTSAAVLVVSAMTAVVLARVGHTPQARLLVAWPQQLPLPPAALGAGLLGALAFGEEFRHPALAADRGTVPRRLGLLTAKLLVAAATALALAVLTVGCDAEVLYLVYGQDLARIPGDWFSLSASWLGLMVGCAWAGVLAAGVFRSTTAGLAAVLAVPVLVVPLVQKLVEGSSVRAAAGLPMRMRQMFLLQWPFGGERYLEAAARVVAQPVGSALTLSLSALLCAYLLTALRSRAR